MPDFLDALALPIERTARLTILHPVTFEPLKDEHGNVGWIDTLSFESQPAHEHRLARDNAIRRLGRDFDAAEDWRDLGEMYAKLTVGWHLVSLTGRALHLPCDFPTATTIFTAPATRWLRLLVQAHLGTRGNFFPLAGSPTSGDGPSANGGSTSEPGAAAPDAATTSLPPSTPPDHPAP